MINPLYSKIAHGFILAPKPFLLTFKFAISLYLMYKTGHGSKNLFPVEAGCGKDYAFYCGMDNSRLITKRLYFR